MSKTKAAQWRRERMGKKGNGKNAKQAKDYAGAG